ncbi:caf1 family [Stylonychia lemnae]|uniref:poly(A)-specific ribonuclease n=1 Tax=Stylonychia lemnae TaxID=5949 RepID=A0A078B1T6_STYLE|nr:caf1 family [Stylonychia lemnae]|eukprot:CDW87263.1 caf1 family [Stylonychia lemnae]
MSFIQYFQKVKEYKKQGSPKLQQKKHSNQNLSPDVIEVFNENFFQEIDKIAELAQTYNYISMDTEFPGDVFEGSTQYLLVRENVNNLKLIQLGITLSNEKGEYPKPTCTCKEKWNQSSISLLMNSGIDFEKLKLRGIEHETFAEYFIKSSLVMNSNMHWYGFHTDHDFAYLFRILSGNSIPLQSSQFLQDLSLIFPNFYDIKVIADQVLGVFRGSLFSLSERLGVYRDDNCEHQAGSDSKITAKCFFQLKNIGESLISGCKSEIFGLNQGFNDQFSKIQNQLNNGVKLRDQLFNQEIPENDFDQFLVDQEIYDEDYEIEQYESTNQSFQNFQDQQKASPNYLTMHPGLAAQLDNSQNFMQMTLIDPYQQAQDQNMLFQQQLYKFQNVKALDQFKPGQSNGVNTPTTQTTPSPPLHSAQFNNSPLFNAQNSNLSLKPTGQEFYYNTYQQQVQSIPIQNQQQSMYQQNINSNLQQFNQYLSIQQQIQQQQLPASLFQVYKNM